MVNLNSITSELSTSAYFLIIILYIIAAIFLFLAFDFYQYRNDSNDISNRWIVYLLIGLVAITIGSIPYMISAPIMPTITRNGNVITVTNYTSLGSDPSLELWGYYDNNIRKIYDKPQSGYNSWTYRESMNLTKFAVRNYAGGLVFSQSAYL